VLLLISNRMAPQMATKAGGKPNKNPTKTQPAINTGFQSERLGSSGRATAAPSGLGTAIARAVESCSSPSQDP
jgi:hypothetical protein